MASNDDVLTRFKDETINVGVIGLGYVGLPLCVACVKSGLKVTGFDIDEQRVTVLNSRRSVLRSVTDQQVDHIVQTGRFLASSDFRRLADMDAILMCLPTPLGHHREPDLTFVESASRLIAKTLHPNQLVVLESTTYPGTTDEVVRPILETSGLKSGIDFYLAYSPEREDPGNPDFTTSMIPRVVGADDPRSESMAEALYSRIVHQVVRVSNSRVAEAVKITENIFRCVNIALVNELKIIFDRMGINIWEVIDAAKSKPFGFMPFYPGPGLGGHCIPIDPFYLTWKAREFDITTRFIEIAGEINAFMPYHIVDRVSEGLSLAQHRSLSGANILIAGLAYKKNVDDLRESPALKIWDLLEKRGVKVSFLDQLVPMIPRTREYSDLAGRRTVLFQKDVIEKFDAVVITTDHDAIDYQQMVAWARLVFDSRNATKSVKGELRDKIRLI